MITDTGPSALFAIDDRGDVGHVRRWLTGQCQELAFSEKEVGRVAVIAQEALRNIVKYAGRGTCLARFRHRGERLFLELLFLDQGPGMSDPEQCLEDRYSTGGSAGEGLGSIRRQSDEFDLWSSPGKGTALLSRVAKGTHATPTHRPAPSWGAVCTAKAKQEVSGDHWGVLRGESGWTLMVADGLGHGPEAARASLLAVHELHDGSAATPLESLLGAMHAALRPSRGAAVSLVRWSPADAACEVVGVGNVAVSIVAPGEMKQAVTHNGIVGHQMRKTRGFTYPVPPGALLVCASDGLKTRWNFDEYPGLLRRDPAIIASVLHRDFQRGSDDATVLVFQTPRHLGFSPR